MFRQRNQAVSICKSSHAFNAGTYFFLSMSGMSLRSAFSQITYKRHKNKHDEEIHSMSSDRRDLLIMNTYWNAVWVLGSDALRFDLALLCYITT